MKTRITELFKIRYPILLSGMTGVSTPELVAAVSNSGGLGILATGNLNFDQTRQAVRNIRSLTNKPFGANMPLIFPGSDEKARILFDEKVPVINYSWAKATDWQTACMPTAVNWLPPWSPSGMPSPPNGTGRTP